MSVTTPTKEIVVPQHVRRKAGIKAGEPVDFIASARSITIKPKRVVDADDMLTPAEAKKVRHGMKQIKEGRFKLWRDVKHELGR